jgi:hypothetical protein
MADKNECHKKTCRKSYLEHISFEQSRVARQSGVKRQHLLSGFVLQGLVKH